jgi:phage gp29-like protein
MARSTQLLDRWGNPIRRTALTAEVSAATVGGARSPISGTPADGLDPVRLASILRSADQGDPIRYMELAEVIEERDPHYLGVLGTRRRSVSQIDITVEAASDDPADVAKADMVRNWLDRDELTEEIFHILDSIGKGYSFTEIIWDTSEGQWMPDRLELRDPRWFRFDRRDLTTPVMLDETGQDRPLDGFKFIYARMAAKSGLPLRSGLARVATWGWLFKAYTQRDWAIFTQTYGQPLRVGKYGPGASERDKDTLFNAVANIAGDCAAIVPESMTIDFKESGNVGAASGLYMERADWLDRQISKAVLGQTATTDAVTGGLGSGKEHREVQEDIERADAKALAGILNRDLIKPWMILEFGEQKRYPRLKIGRPEAEDLDAAASALEKLVPLGLRVSMSAVRDKFGWADPKAGEEVLTPPAPNAQPAALVGGGMGAESAVKYPLNTLGGSAGISAALQAESLSEAISDVPAQIDALSGSLASQTRPEMAKMLLSIEAMLQAASSFDEFAEMLRVNYPKLDIAALDAVFDMGLMTAFKGGELAIAESRNG